MSKIFTYIRNNENNQKYTLEQRASVENYLFKNNITDFKFEILKTFKTSKYAYIYEAYLHNKYDAANNPRFINRRNEFCSF